MRKTADIAPAEIPTIPGARIILRPLRPADARSLVRHANDPQVARWVPDLPQPYTAENAYDWLNRARELAGERSAYHFAIEHRESGQVIGMIGLKYINRPDRRAEIGYWLGRAFWRQGMTEEAIRLVARFAFRSLHLHSLTAVVLGPNRASSALLEKVGFRHEGTWRKDCRLRRRWYDAPVYGLLDREFRDNS